MLQPSKSYLTKTDKKELKWKLGISMRIDLFKLLL
jgi:hypothetical protein